MHSKDLDAALDFAFSPARMMPVPACVKATFSIAATAYRTINDAILAGHELLCIVGQMAILIWTSDAPPLYPVMDEKYHYTFEPGPPAGPTTEDISREPL